MGELLELFWTSHRDQLFERISNLLDSQVGNDFEIWCADPRPLKAHFFILRMFSPVLSHADCRTFCLEDEAIERNDVSCLLEFIYRGKTQVPVDRLDAVKKVAEKLEIQSFLELIADIKINEAQASFENPDLDDPSSERNAAEVFENDETNFATLNYNTANLIADLSEKGKEVPDDSRKNCDNDVFEVAEDSGYSFVVNKNDLKFFKTEECSSSSEDDLNEKKPVKILLNSCESNTVKTRSKRKSQIPDSLICFICQKQFKSKDSIRSHRMCHVDPVQCPHCPLMVRRLDQHVATKHGMDQQGKILDKHFECDECDFSCVAKFILRKHKRSRHNEARVECDQCAFVTNTESNLKSHKRQVHSDERPFKCEVCGSAFKTSSVLSLHKARHLEKVECEFCGQKFCLTSIKRHRQLHLERGSMMRFKCSLCSFRSRYRYNLKVHLKKIHDLTDEAIGSLTSSEAVRVKPDEGLSRSESSEVSGGSVKRKRCFKGRKKTARKRAISQPGQKTKVCEICGLVLSCHSVLYRHRRMHREGEALKNRNKCPVCEFSTVQRCNLKIHCKKKHKMSDEQVNSILVNISNNLSSDNNLIMVEAIENVDEKFVPIENEIATRILFQ